MREMGHQQESNLRFLILCFCSRIREAIAINKVAAIFVVPWSRIKLDAGRAVKGQGRTLK